MPTHALDQLRGDASRIDQGFIGCHVKMQVPLVDAPERPKVRAKRGAGPFTGVAMNLTTAIAIIIPRPLVSTVADSRVAWMAPAIALPLIGIEQGAAYRNVLRDQRRTGVPVRMVADPPALLTCVARDDADDGGTIVGLGAVPFALIGATTGWISGIAMRRAFFPPRCGTARRLRRPCPPSQPSVPSH